MTPKYDYLAVARDKTGAFKDRPIMLTQGHRSTSAMLKIAVKTYDVLANAHTIILYPLGRHAGFKPRTFKAPSTEWVED